MKAGVITLALLLAACIALGGILYSKYLGAEEDKKFSEEKILELTRQIDELKRERLAQIEEKTAKLKEEVEKSESELQAQKARTEDIKAAYDAMISELRDEIGKKQVSISRLEEQLSITFIDRVLFEFGKATLTPQGSETLEKVGKGLKHIRNQKVRVMGHADDIPIRTDYRHLFPSNWELSAARAAAVVRFFQDKIGLDPRSMEAVGLSFYYPVASNETPEGRAQNRRVEVTVGPEMD